MKKYTVVTLLVLACTMVWVGQSQAVRLLDEEKALKEMFPKADQVVAEEKELTNEEIDALKELLGGKLNHITKIKGKKLRVNTDYDFHFAMKDGQKVGVAVIEKQPGKWGPVEFIVALDAATGKVANLAVMSYKERRGRPIARKNFLKQFLGLGSKARIKVKRDIRAISGATISSDCACFAVKKVIALYRVLYGVEEPEEKAEK